MAISNEQVVAVIRKNPIPTVCVAVIIGVAAGLYFRSDLVNQAGAELDGKSQEGRRMANNIKYATQLKEQLEALTEANQEIDRRLVQAGNLAANLQYFYKLEADTGTKLVDLRQLGTGGMDRGKAKKGPKTAFEPVNYSVAVQGTYAQLVSFLQRLEHGEHFSRVLSASFMPAAGAAVGGESSSGRIGRSEMLTLTLSLDLLGQP